MGTPVDLREAIQQAIQEILPEQKITRDGRHVQRVHDIIQDRLSQSFTAAMCEAQNQDPLRRLWYAIFPHTHKRVI